jgi:hypothetical protein
VRRLVLPFGLALAIAAGPAGVANGAQRYASPGGSGEVCSQASPCSLEEAVGKAESNDEVIVTPGAYALAAAVKTPAGKTGIEIHGQAEQPPPKLVASLEGPALEIGRENRLSRIEVENTGRIPIGISCREAALVDRVRVLVAGGSSKAVQQRTSCTVRDSLLQAEGAHAIGLLSDGGQDTAVARNLTVIVRGAESIGASSEGDAGSPDVRPVHLLDLKNSIVRAEGTDLVSNLFRLSIMDGSPLEAVGDIAVAYSNFATSEFETESTIAEGPGNQRAMPIFVDAELGDYTQAAASPTVDAGVNDQLGPLDLAGRKRVQGAAPDIGAYEFPAPKTAVCTCINPGHGGIRSISISPKRFRHAKGTVVTYRMSDEAPVRFRVSRRIKHRKAYRPLKGSFTREGKAGKNRFAFHGRLDGRPLKPGSYRLLGSAGNSIRRASFTIVR